MSNSKNVAIIDIDNYNKMRDFYNTVKKGEHVKIHISHGYDYIIYGNTDKFSEEIITINKELSDKLSKCENEKQSLTYKHRNLVRKCEKLESDDYQSYKDLWSDEKEKVKKKNFAVIVLVVLFIVQLILLCQ